MNLPSGVNTRLHVGRRIRRQLLRRAAGHRHRPDVVVGRARFLVDAVAVRDEHDLLAVGRERDARRLPAASAASRSRPASGRAASPPRQRRDEDVMTDVLAPLVPVAIEQPRQEVHVRRRVFALLHVGDERDRRAVGRDHHRRLHAAGDLRDLPDVAAVGVGDVDLQIAVASGDERDVRAVGRPARRVLGLVAADRAAAARPIRRPARSRCRRCACRVATSVVVRTNATTCRPSGESCGSPTRTAPSRSWIVIGRAAAAGAARRESAAAAAAARDRAVMRRIVGRVFDAAESSGPADLRRAYSARSATSGSTAIARRAGT